MKQVLANSHFETFIANDLVPKQVMPSTVLIDKHRTLMLIFSINMLIHADLTVVEFGVAQ